MSKIRTSPAKRGKTKGGAPLIRGAQVGDVREIHRLLAAFSQEGTILPRSMSELYDHIRDYKVCVESDSGKLVGACALHVCWENLAEIRSLVVEKGWRRKGIGTHLTKACIKGAGSLGVDKVFVLTNAPPFFERLGFARVDKATLPQKVWSDCIRCVKFPECDEEALVLELG